MVSAILDIRFYQKLHKATMALHVLLKTQTKSEHLSVWVDVQFEYDISHVGRQLLPEITKSFHGSTI